MGRVWSDRSGRSQRLRPFYLVNGRGTRSLASPGTLSRLSATRPFGWQSIRSRLVSGIWTGGEDECPGVVSAPQWFRSTIVAVVPLASLQIGRKEKAPPRVQRGFVNGAP